MSNNPSVWRSLSHPAKPIEHFPDRGLMPKEDTQVSAFLNKYPEYDGRGTVIGIMDTGVDPAAYGLQVTSDGKPKIIDIIDCTGSGDVIMEKADAPTRATVDGEDVLTLKGLTGRTLILSEDWKNPTGEYRLGVKSLYDMFPTPLVGELKWNAKQRMIQKNNPLLSQAQNALSDFKAAHPDTKNLGEADDAIFQDLTARVTLLQKWGEQFEDIGHLADCLLFHDGEHWVAVVAPVDTTDLRQVPRLRDYKVAQEYHTFSARDQMSYSVKVYDEGKVLSIVTTAGYHGTHVAGITAAYHPDDPAVSGIAPGAQLISLKIGDHRLSSMETGTGVTRAAIALVDSRCDLANMSYGEPAAEANRGYFVDLVREEVVGRYGCIFVSSAGNEGPGLSTVGCPGGTTSDVIGVGAYVGHSQMRAEYALTEMGPEVPYTWSSRGPTQDGAVGVDIYAPGSAVTSYPAYTLKRANLLNGTSMSSPNACGCLALLLSACKATGLSYTPFRVKSAMVNSAKSVDDPFNVGFIQVDAAWAYLQKYAGEVDQDINFKVDLPNSNAGGRGVYLREPSHTATPAYCSVRISPTFMAEHDDADAAAQDALRKAQFAFEKRVTVVTSAAYVRAPDFVYLNSAGTTFNIVVDPTALTAGRFYFTEVLGYDAAKVDRGPLFRIPVTICKPELPNEAGSLRFTNLTFTSAAIERRFVHVPLGASHAVVRVISHNADPTAPTRFDLHATQLRRDRRFNYLGARFNAMLFACDFGKGKGDSQVIRRGFNVSGNGTLELCLAQFWSGPGAHTLSLEVDFHGFQLMGASSNSDGAVLLDLPAGITRLDMATPLRPEESIAVTAKLTHLQRSLRPSNSVIRPLSRDRDLLPNQTVTMELVLTYPLNGYDGNRDYLFSMPLFNNVVYDTVIENVALMVFDARKKLLAYQGSYVHMLSLPCKGDYTVLVQLRHSSLKLLQSYVDMPLLMRYALPKGDILAPKVTLGSRLTSPDNVKAGRRWMLTKGSQTPMYLHTTCLSRPAAAKAGDMLCGDLCINCPSIPNGVKFPLIGPVPPVPIKTTNGGSQDDEGGSGDDKASGSVAASSSVRGSIPTVSKTTSGIHPTKSTDQTNRPAASSSDGGLTGPAIEGVSAADATGTGTPSLAEQYREALWKWKLEWAKKAKDDATLRQRLLDELDGECDQYLPYLEYLLEQAAEKMESAAAAPSSDDQDQASLATAASSLRHVALETMNAADRVITRLDAPALAAAVRALPPSFQSKEYKAKQKELKEQVASLVNAYRHRVEALLMLTRGPGGSSSSDQGHDGDADYESQLTVTFSEYSRWQKRDFTDIGYLKAYVQVELRAGRHGNALTAILTYQDKVERTVANVKDLTCIDHLKIEVLRKAGYDNWADHFADMLRQAVPKSYAAF
ncbi:hypothetical protein IWQ60_007009 [Tieghemiomyces parasiticus]|uniref:tripeptidyl-peptidase II n=1 Tax=Tieghemiomyces parasiticus TaxID=78921 RepID=A0A9W8DRZ7_9FUNG|nr:hypothetical protein IWQ60_007009 [Tieghemiomyces parasiticus]